MTTVSITYQSYINPSPDGKLLGSNVWYISNAQTITVNRNHGRKTTWANFTSIPIWGSESQFDIDITFTECIPGGGVLQEFLVGVCRWQNYKPALVYGKWTENHTLTYGIPCEIRPMSIQNMQTKILFGGTIYKILRVWEWQVISSLLHSSIKNIPLVTDYLRKRYPSLRIQGSNKYPSQRLNPNNPHIVSTHPPPGSASVVMT